MDPEVLLQVASFRSFGSVINLHIRVGMEFITSSPSRRSCLINVIVNETLNEVVSPCWFVACRRIQVRLSTGESEF